MGFPRTIHFIALSALVGSFFVGMIAMILSIRRKEPETMIKRVGGILNIIIL